MLIFFIVVIIAASCPEAHKAIKGTVDIAAPVTKYVDFK